VESLFIVLYAFNTACEFPEVYWYCEARLGVRWGWRCSWLLVLVCLAAAVWDTGHPAPRRLHRDQAQGQSNVQLLVIALRHNAERSRVAAFSSRRDDLSRNFFSQYYQSYILFTSSPSPPRSNADTSRLRSYEIYPRLSTRTKRYCSLVQYGLSHYQNRIANS